MPDVKIPRRIIARVTMRQIDGDDGHQWCVLIDGRVKWNGMTRSEASWRRRREIEALFSVSKFLPAAPCHGDKATYCYACGQGEFPKDHS